MILTGVLLCWLMICLTNLRFRQACQLQGKDMIPEAKSPLQPFLAWWGICWTTFLSDPFQVSARSYQLVFFQGYLAFTRHNPYWSEVSKSWGFTVGPYIYVILFILLILFWQLRTRIVDGEWSLHLRPLDRIDLGRGVSAKNLPRKEHPQLWRRALAVILDTI